MADEVTERYRQALEGIDAALRRHVPHLRSDNRAAWALAEDVRSMLTVSGIGFVGATTPPCICPDNFTTSESCPRHGRR